MEKPFKLVKFEQNKCSYNFIDWKTCFSYYKAYNLKINRLKNKN